jgi:hypothetical protein
LVQDFFLFADCGDDDDDGGGHDGGSDEKSPALNRDARTNVPNGRLGYDHRGGENGDGGHEDK